MSLDDLRRELALQERRVTMLRARKVSRDALLQKLRRLLDTAEAKTPSDWNTELEWATALAEALDGTLAEELESPLPTLSKPRKDRKRRHATKKRVAPSVSTQHAAFVETTDPREWAARVALMDAVDALQIRTPHAPSGEECGKLPPWLAEGAESETYSEDFEELSGAEENGTS